MYNIARPGVAGAKRVMAAGGGGRASRQGGEDAALNITE